MKRIINTNVLNGFLTQAISHNKYLEESEMWKKKRELDDETTRSRAKHRSPEKSSKKTRKSSPEENETANNLPKNKQSSEEIDDLQVLLALYKDATKKPVERWDHSGFAELYPDNNGNRKFSDFEKRVYDNTETDTCESSSSGPKKKKSKKRKKKDHKHKKHKKKKHKS